MIKFHVYESAQAACEAAGILIAAQVIAKPESVLGLATGSTPIPVYRTLVQWYQKGILDFRYVHTFNLDEYIGIDPENPLSYHAFMREHLFDKVNLPPENARIPSGGTLEDCAAYDAAIQAAGGIDIQLLGIGKNGHIGFNEPADGFTFGTHIAKLTASTIDANSRFFANAGDVPRKAISMGIGNIMQARSIVLVATGTDKADAVRRMLYGPVTPQVPASVLQLHPHCTVLLDREAASLTGGSLC